LLTLITTFGHQEILDSAKFDAVLRLHPLRRIKAHHTNIWGRSSFSISRGCQTVHNILSALILLLQPCNRVIGCSSPCSTRLNGQSAALPCCRVRRFVSIHNSTPRKAKSWGKFLVITLSLTRDLVLGCEKPTLVAAYTAA
jgi:hypothetical protein